VLDRLLQLTVADDASVAQDSSQDRQISSFVKALF
jgi:hypothetical protein